MVKLAPHFNDEVRDSRRMNNNRTQKSNLAMRSFDNGVRNSRSLNRSATNTTNNTVDTNGLERDISFVPPPGSYKPYKKEEQKTLMGKFGRALKDRTDCNGVPGPGSYEPRLLRSRGNKTYSIGSSRRPKAEINLEFPTPSTYIPDHRHTKFSSRAWSFGHEKQRPDTVKNITVRGLNHESDISKLQTMHNFYEYDQVNPHTYFPEKPKRHIAKAPFHQDIRKALHYITGTYVWGLTWSYS